MRPPCPGTLRSGCRAGLPVLLAGIVISLAPAPGRASPQDLQEEIRRFEASGRSAGLSWSVQFAPARGGAPVLDINPAKPFPPASLTKLVSAACALETLGRDYAFETRIYGRGSLERGVLAGDLVVQGGGDPFLVSERLWMLSQALSQTGLKEVQGRLILDTGLFARLEDDRPREQERRRTQRPYAAGLSALSVNFNAACFLVGPGTLPGDPGIVTQDPIPCGYLGLAGSLVTSDAADSWSLLLRPSGSSGPDAGGTLEIAEAAGSIPAGSAPRRVYRSVSHPQEFAGSLLRAFFEDAGIRIRGGTVSGAINPKDTLLLAFPSLPLGDLVSSALLHSNNFMADMIAMPLGQADAARKAAPSATAGASNPAGAAGGMGPWSLAGSAEVMTDWLRERFGAGEGEGVQDGSGLSRENRLSGRTLLRLLTWAYNDLQIGPDFVSSLPRPGEDGTLKKRFDEGEAPVLRAKTGTYNDLGVSALAGYAEGEGGEVWAFVLLMQSENSKKWNVLEMQDLQERWLLTFLR